MFHEKFIPDHSKLISIVENLKREKKKIVFTNGCFDIIHPGHVDYLEKAKKLGDVLIVAINSDDSVKRLKGEKRPIFSEIDRAKVLSAFYFVDFITVFSEDTPLSLIEKILPDFLVKGGDWSVNRIVGRDVVLRNGGKVLSIPFVEGYSTTDVIEKVIRLYCQE